MNVLDALEGAEERAPIIAAIFLSNDGFYRVWVDNHITTEAQMGLVLDGFAKAVSTAGAMNTAGRA